MSNSLLSYCTLHLLHSAIIRSAILSYSRRFSRKIFNGFLCPTKSTITGYNYSLKPPDMIQTLAAPAVQLVDPQVLEFHVEHPQAPTPPIDHRQADAGDFLVVSPYTFAPHLLDLRKLDVSHQLLAKALTHLDSVRPDYAKAPYTDSFNWPTVLTQLKTRVQENDYTWKRQHFYIVVFRSQIPPSTNRIELGELDQRSHAEATKSGGLLKYWFGMPDADGRNLATCKPKHHLNHS